MDEDLKMRSQAELIGIIDSLQMLIGDQNIQLVELRHRRDDLLRSNNDYENRYREEKQLRLEAQAILSMVAYPFPGGSPHWHLQEMDEKLAKVDLAHVRKLLEDGAKYQGLDSIKYSAIDQAIATVEAEEELDGDPPADIAALFKDEKTAVLCLRTAVLGTKKSIIKKLLALKGGIELNAGAEKQQPSVQDGAVSLSLASYDELNSRLAVRDGILDKIFVKVTEWQEAGGGAREGIAVLYDIQSRVYNFMQLPKAEEAGFDVNRDNGKV
jgi:hypothetical protein